MEISGVVVVVVGTYCAEDWSWTWACRFTCMHGRWRVVGGWLFAWWWMGCDAVRV